MDTEPVLYAEQPPEGIYGLLPGQLLRVLKEVYGTVRGTASWRETFCTLIKSLSYLKSRMDQCAYILPPVGFPPAVNDDPYFQDPTDHNEWLICRLLMKRPLKPTVVGSLCSSRIPWMQAMSGTGSS